MKRKRDEMAMKNMSLEQLKTFNTIKELAAKYNEDIRFDNKVNKILIPMPKMLITLLGETVYMHNTSGFASVTLPAEAFELLVECIEKEAHKDRRRLEKEVKDRLNHFLDNIIVE
jgi:hypothetical protein